MRTHCCFQIPISLAKTGVDLWESIGSVIQSNHIGFIDYGFRSYLSPFISLFGNTIGWPAQRGKIAIRLHRSGGSAISNNSQVEATQYGLTLYYNDVLVDHNNINVYGQNNQNGGGIYNFRGNGTQIINNYIDVGQSSFGIETVSSVGAEISNNPNDHFSSISARTPCSHQVYG